MSRKNVVTAAIGLMQIVLIMGATMFITQCGSSKVATRERPEWVDKGDGFFTGDRGKAFYGVGAASNIALVSLRRSTADVQARVDLGRVFNLHIQDLQKGYIRATTAGPNLAQDTEQLQQQTTKAFTEMDLSGSRIIDRYYDTAEQTQYSLAVLDMDDFKSQVEKMKALNAEVKKMIVENAEKAFKELEEESAKRSQ